MNPQATKDLGTATTVTRAPRIVQPQLTSPLLALPAELKLIIYSYALVQPDRIDIVPGTTPQPALLCTSPEIRKDASPVYWLGNRFTYHVVDFSSAGARHVRKHRRRSAVYYAWNNNGHWRNLLEWLQAYHAGVARPMSKPGPRPGPTDTLCWVLCACFETVKKARKRGLAWDVVAELVEPQRVVLACLDGDWAVDK